MWLNEGFASWIEYLCVDHCFPEYDIWTQFASSDFTNALELDALNNSHPIEVRTSLTIYNSTFEAGTRMCYIVHRWGFILWYMIGLETMGTAMVYK